MRANIYVLFETRMDENSSEVDVAMAGGTQRELIDYYTNWKGHPPRTVEETSMNGHALWLLDQDDRGQAIIAQYKVGIQEIID